MTPTPPQEQTERMSTDSNTTMPVVAWLLTDLDLQPVSDVGDDLFAFRRPVLVSDKNDCIPAVRLVDARSAIAALQREVEELRKLLIDIMAALPALRDNGVAKLYALAIDNALAASKAEVPNG